MIILVQGSPTTLERDHGRHPNLGVLSGPRRVYTNVDGWPWAADNDAFLAWDENRYLKMLDTITGIPGCLFVTAPDVVANYDETLMRFYDWRQTIVATGKPIAFVAQDGFSIVDTPWQLFDCLFIGGTTEFKLGQEAASAIRTARRLGKWIHMGRVNTRTRIRYAKSVGCDSIDGTNFSMYRKTNLPWALTWASSEQLWTPA